MKIDRSGNLRLGRTGENTAARYLKRKGFDILSRNLKLKNAEVDILARDGVFFVLVEVKTMRFRPDHEQHPGIHYTNEQKKRQFRAAREFLNKFDDPDFPVRHDLIEILAGRFFPIEIRHHINICAPDVRQK